MACRLGMKGPRLLPWGPTLQSGTPSRPPQRAEASFPRIAAAALSALRRTSPRGPEPGSTLGEREGERRAGRERGREGGEGRERKRKPQ